MKIYLGADHRGFHLKNQLKDWLKKGEYDITDLGAHEFNPDDDYVDYAVAVAKRLSGGSPSAVVGSRDSFGIALCGSGVGMDIVANRFKGIRCGLGLSPDQVRAARHDDDINVLAIAADYTELETAKAIVKTFVETEFSGEERYVRRIKNIDEELLG